MSSLILVDTYMKNYVFIFHKKTLIGIGQAYVYINR